MSTRAIAVRIALVTALLLLIPLVAMQFTDEVVWTPFDFVFAAVLFGGTGVLLTLVARRRAIVPRVAAVAVGLAAIAAGEDGDAPGLAVFGGLLIAAVVALALRAGRRPAT